MNPVPFEHADPELGRLVEWFVFQPAMVRRKVNTVVSDKAPGRNEPCPCESGKKYKRCCGACP